MVRASESEDEVEIEKSVWFSNCHLALIYKLRPDHFSYSYLSFIDRELVHISDGAVSWKLITRFSKIKYEQI
jgi:hypothetical protein